MKADLTEDEEIAYLWDLAIPKSKGWQQSNTAVVRGDKGDLRRAWKLAKKRTNLSTIKLSLDAQRRFRRDSRLANDLVPQPKLIGAWLRAERWDDEIESHADLKEKKSKYKCCLCEEPSMGRTIDVCETHFAEKYIDFSTNISWLKKNNLYKLKSESVKQWGDRCHDYLSKALPKLHKKMRVG